MTGPILRTFPPMPSGYDALDANAMASPQSFASAAAPAFAPSPSAAPSAPAPTAPAAPGKPHFFNVNERASDAADLLPSAAATKYRALRDLADDLHAPLRDLWENAHFERQEGQKLQIQIDQIRDNTPSHQHAALELDPHFANLKARHARRMTEAARFQARNDTSSASWKQVRSLVENLRRYVVEAPRGTLLPYVGPEPVLKKGETPASALERAQRRGREIESDIAKIKSAPIPSTLAKAIVREQFRALAEKGEPNFSSVIDHAEPATFAKMSAEVFTPDVSQLGLGVSVPDSVAFLAWALGDDLIKIAERAIDKRAADDQGALDPKQRAEALATARADLLATEREEAHWCVVANVPLRPSIDARAALGINGPAPRD